MKTVFVALMLLALMASASHAACAPKAGDGFDKAVERCGAFDDQTDMNLCSHKLLEVYNRKLDTAYSKLIGLVKSSPEARRQIQAQERAWVEYKHTYLEAAFPGKDKRLEYGSSYPLQSNLLELGLVRDHIDDIQSLIDSYSPH